MGAERSSPAYREKSRQRLSDISIAKIRTAFIGALSSFEEAFGGLWGQGSPDPTSEQLRARAVWESVRKEILDKGNAQIRNMKTELSFYDVIWNRYHMEFRNNREDG